jgi:ABC-type nitrate/sulfonate/bicarbonate transport system permease component
MTVWQARRRVRRVPGRALLGLVPLLAVLGYWQLFGSATSVSFPRPNRWFTALDQLTTQGQLLLGPATLVTLETFALSLAIATVLGVGLGMIIGASRTADRALTPFMEFFRSLPPPALVPIALLLLGATLKMMVTVVVVAIVWPILLNTIAAMHALPRVRLEMSRALGLSRTEHVFKVILPSLLPGIFVGVRIAVAVSLIVTLLVDYLSGARGLGSLLSIQQGDFNDAAVWGLLLLIGVFGFVLNGALAIGERRILSNWSASSG